MKVKVIKANSPGRWYAGKVGNTYEAVLVEDVIGMKEFYIESENAIIDYSDAIIISIDDPHYNNDNGSLYKFATDHDLNSYEFEVVKRIVRCRKKGEWETDIEKTIRVLELYQKEMGHNFKGERE